MKTILLYIVHCILIIGSLPLSAQFVNKGAFESITVINEELINTAEIEFSPGAWGDKIIFVHSNPNAKKVDKRIGESFFDLKYAVKGFDGELIRSAYLPDVINTPFHEGPSSMDDSGQLFYTSDCYENKQLIRDEQGRVNLQIYISKYRDGQWLSSEKWTHCTPEYSYAHPSISAGGDTLIFASNRMPSLGKMDLFISVKSNGIWSEPSPIHTANSSFNDWFPNYIKGKLFFSSDRNDDGRADLDVYVLNLEGDSLSVPEMLPAPINGNQDDFGFIANDDLSSGYFSSNRVGGKGKDDIYRWQTDSLLWTKKLEKEELINLTLMGNGFNNLDIPFKIRYVPFDSIQFNTSENWDIISNKIQIDLERINFENVIDSTMTKGMVNISIPKGQFLHFQLMDDRFRPFEEIILQEISDTLWLDFSRKPEPTKEVKPLRKTILNVPVEKGSIIVFNNIYFEFSSASLQAGAQKELNLLADAMLEDQSIKVQLSAHTDSRGSDVANQKLSDERAKAAKNYLVQKGVDSLRIYAVGFGESRLRNHCDDGVACSDDQHRFNRRIEVKILE